MRVFFYTALTFYTAQTLFCTNTHIETFRYVCKGGNVRLLKKFNSDWYVFAESDGGDQFVTLGSMPERPTYQDVQKMLDEKGVGYKYARDLGMAPPLK